MMRTANGRCCRASTGTDGLPLGCDGALLDQAKHDGQRVGAERAVGTGETEQERSGELFLPRCADWARLTSGWRGGEEEVQLGALSMAAASRTISPQPQARSARAR